MNKFFLFLMFLCISCLADEIHAKNSKANRLYEKGKYEEALKLYNDALLESPDNKKLAINKGSTLYQLEKFDKARKSYESALSIEDKNAKADLHYNLGNTNFRQGEQFEKMANPQASEKYKAALEHYKQTLELRPGDTDAKHNLQLAYRRIKRMKQQKQKQQQNKKQDKDKKQDQKSGKKNDKDKRKKKQEQQQDDKKQQQQQQQKQKNKQGEKKQPPPTKPKKQKSDMEKKKALRLLKQYADDAKDLKKPKKKTQAIPGGKPEKDW